MYKGIDISTYQTGIDWDRVKKSGCDFAVIRAGFGNDISQKDNMFESHIKGALGVGIKVGIYWFGYAYTEAMARQEADVCHRVISAYKNKLSLPVFYDWEYDSMRYAKDNGVNPNRALVTSMTIAFMDRMKELGYESGYYTNQDYLGNYYDTSRMKGYPLWMAYYSSDRYSGCVMQQYTSSGKIDGIPGNVDCNYFYGEFSDGKPEKPATEEITVGSKVKIAAGAHYTNGVAVPSSVLTGTYTVQQMSTSKTEALLREIFSWISVDYLSVAGSESPTGSQAKCTGSGVRIRAEAHTAANIYGYANVGDTIKLLADDGWGWSKVQCNGVVGWMSNEYISVKRSGYKTAVCNGTYVNVRNGASTSAGIIRQMQPGDQFQVVCIQPNGWIDTGNGFVYYDKSYISI